MQVLRVFSYLGKTTILFFEALSTCFSFWLALETYLQNFPSLSTTDPQERTSGVAAILLTFGNPQ